MGSPYKATDTFVERFKNSPQEQAIQVLISMLSVGSTMLKGIQRPALEGERIGLLAGVLYDRYDTLGFDGNQGRLAVPRDFHGVYYYGPYHGDKGPGVPNGWIAIIYPVLGYPK